MKAKRNINAFINLKAELIACLKAEGAKESWVLPHLRAIGLFNSRHITGAKVLKVLSK